MEAPQMLLKHEKSAQLKNQTKQESEVNLYQLKQRMKPTLFLFYHPETGYYWQNGLNFK
jgi:hypothetical protein